MGELIDPKERIKTVRALLEKSKPQIAMALPRHMNADRLTRIAMTSVMRNPRLLDCTPESLIGAVVQCAQLGLEPDDLQGHAYLVPFRNSKRGTIEVQLIPGYRGLMALARRSKEITVLYADVVRDKDEFSFRKGTDQFLHHVPSSATERGGAVWIYAIARFRNGHPQFEVMSVSEVEQIRKRSKSGQEGPWVTDWDEMAKKTVTRSLCKYLPASTELATAVALDERAEVGLPQDLEILAAPAIRGAEPTNGDKGGLDKLTEKLKTEKKTEDKSDGKIAKPPQATVSHAEKKEGKKATKEKMAAKPTNGEGAKPEEKFDPKETALTLIRNATKQDWADTKATVLKMVKEVKGSQNVLDVTTALNARQREILK